MAFCIKNLQQCAMRSMEVMLKEYYSHCSREGIEPESESFETIASDAYLMAAHMAQAEDDILKTLLELKQVKTETEGNVITLGGGNDTP